jgi:TolB-like protein/class 3 adenylate cyclase/Tfp pilus assembly protein PilF
MPESEDKLEKLLDQRHRLDEELERHRRPLTILFADIAGSTGFYDQHGDVAGAAMVERFQKLLAPAVSEHKGRLVKTLGDGILVSFESPVDAARCARSMQSLMLARNQGRPASEQIAIRVALNTGLALVKGDDVLGDVVNVCARIEAAAAPGEILISPSTFAEIAAVDDLAVRKKASGVAMKGKAPLDLYEIVWRAGEPVPLPVPPPHRPRRWAVAAVLMAVLLAVAGLAYLFWRHSAALSKQIRSIAVLPLSNFSGDPAQAFFADGMTEELTNQLAQIGSLSVIARTSVMQYKDTKKTIPEIARELAVDAVIEGSVVTQGGTVRITAQLINTHTNAHIWSHSYEQKLSDVLAVQSQVASEIAAQVKAEVTPDERKRLSAVHTVNPAAYELYLRGRFVLNSYTEAGNREALALFQKAIAIDPNYAAAFSGLANAYGALSTDYEPPRSVMPQALEAVNKALALDDGLGEAHSARAWILFNYEWDFPGAAQECRRALELNPSNADAHGAYSWYLAAIGDVNRAVAEAARARELDPLSPIAAFNNLWVLVMSRRYDDVIAMGQSILAAIPDLAAAHMVMGMALAQKGDFAHAISESQAGTLDGSAIGQAMLAGTYAMAKDRVARDRTIAAIQARGHYVCSYEVAAAYVPFGESAEAIHWLQKAYDDRDVCVPWMKVDPRFDQLRPDPRYQALMQKVGFP